MPYIDGKKFAQEGLLNIGQHCAQAALHAPLLTGRTEIKVEVITEDELTNLFAAEHAMHMQMAGSTGEAVSMAYGMLGEPPVVLLIGADCMPLLKAPCRGTCPAGIDVPRHIHL